VPTFSSAKPKGVRLGYMGHLTLISEDVISALQHYPPDLRDIITAIAPQPDWFEYVNGRYSETKKRDTSLLGGGKPIVAPGTVRGAARWKVDEEDTVTSTPLSRPDTNNGNANGVHEVKGEFKRASSVRPMRQSSADFGPAPMEDDDDEEEASSTPPQVRSSFVRSVIQDSWVLLVCPLFGSRDAVIRSPHLRVI
jgi:serine/threonine-protein phosphatase 6 regulatory subunit 3